MEQSVPEPPRNAIEAFREVSDKFLELARSASYPAWGGGRAQIKQLLRHPVKSYMSMIQEGQRAQSGIGTFAPWYPWEAMVDFLSKYSEPQLTAIKSLSGVNLRRLKSMITENPIFKLAVPIGSAYAVLQVSNRLIAVHGSTLEFYRQLLALPALQSFMGYLLLVFIFISVIIAIQYLWRTGPTIARAQLLDDILQIALEEKRFAKSIPSNVNDEKTSAGHKMSVASRA